MTVYTTRGAQALRQSDSMSEGIPMISDKQIELSNMLFKKLEKQFPGVELIGIKESVENPDNLWVKVALSENNDDLEIAVREAAREISTDILLDYGYHILVLIGSKEYAKSSSMV